VLCCVVPGRTDEHSGRDTYIFSMNCFFTFSLVRDRWTDGRKMALLVLRYVLLISVVLLLLALSVFLLFLSVALELGAWIVGLAVFHCQIYRY